MFKNTIDYRMEPQNLSCTYRNLTLSLYILAFADKSFTTNHEHTSQLGYITLLC